MKRFIIYLGLFMGILGVDAYARGFERNLIFDDLSTYNYKEKLKEIDLRKVKKICNYDFCEYLDTNNVDKSIETFVNKFLNTINDEEIKNTLKVKGVKITKITLED